MFIKKKKKSVSSLSISALHWSIAVIMADTGKDVSLAQKSLYSDRYYLKVISIQKGQIYLNNPQTIKKNPKK